MRVSDVLAEIGKPFPYYPGIVRLLGDTDAGILFLYLFWRMPDDDHPNSNGWFYRTSALIEHDTALSYARQASACETLVKLNLIEAEVRPAPNGAPTLFFRVLIDGLDRAWKKREKTFADRKAAETKRTAAARIARAEKRRLEKLKKLMADLPILCRTENAPFYVAQRMHSMSDIRSFLCRTENPLIINITTIKQRNIPREKRAEKPARSPKKDVPKPEQKASTKPFTDALYEIWKSVYEADTAYGQPYNPGRHDFPELTKLVKIHKLDLPENLFRTALANYFASDITHRTVADFCQRFAVFTKYALTEYKQPKKKGNSDANPSDGYQSSLFDADVL
jgi:hypothetical protein